MTVYEFINNEIDKTTKSSVRGDATDLSAFANETFDATLVLGPLYHLYEKEDI